MQVIQNIQEAPVPGSIPHNLRPHEKTNRQHMYHLGHSVLPHTVYLRTRWLQQWKPDEDQLPI